MHVAEIFHAEAITNRMIDIEPKIVFCAWLGGGGKARNVGVDTQELTVVGHTNDDFATLGVHEGDDLSGGFFGKAGRNLVGEQIQA